LLTEKQQILWRLRDVKWTKMLRESCIVAGERLCAEFRFRASLLDALKFETLQDRLGVLGKWKEEKMDLAGAHSSWESVELSMHSLFHMMNIFDSGMDLLLRIGVRQRLGASYECLEAAYRRAEARLPKDELAKFYYSPAEQQRLLDDCTVCTICQSPLLDADDSRQESTTGRLYQLPCSHCFHEHCVQQWLHDHSFCPVCRCDLTRRI